VVRKLEVDDFFHLQAEWQKLLMASDADRIFMSWAWLYSWWEVWSDEYDLQLLLLGVYEESSGQLVGLAPLYRHEFRSIAGIKFRRLHFIGNAWRVGPSVRTEYVGLIAFSGCELEVARVVSASLKELEWDELVIPDSFERTAGEFGEALVESGRIQALIRSQSTGIRIDTSEDYADWRDRLGSNTRLKAINRQTFFEIQLQGIYRDFEPGSEGYMEFFDRLNYFHQQRWGKVCFDEKAVDFHLKLLKRLDSDQSPRLTELVCENAVVSVLYDLKAGDRVYNLQSGYSEAFHKKLSLGTLHLGYAITRAFNERSINHYDLLAGHGKNSFYKEKFCGDYVTFTTIEFIRSPFLKLAYRFQACLPQGIRSKINSVLRF
jgi:hypothetical protein